MLGVLRMLATAETVMKHIVSQVIVLADGTALAFAGDAAGLHRRFGTGHRPLRSLCPSPAGAGALPHVFRSPDASPPRPRELSSPRSTCIGTPVCGFSEDGLV